MPKKAARRIAAMERRVCRLEECFEGVEEEQLLAMLHGLSVAATIECLPGDDELMDGYRDLKESHENEWERSKLTRRDLRAEWRSAWLKQWAQAVARHFDALENC